jgi:hypothetical protein
MKSDKETTAAGSRPAPVDRGDIFLRRTDMGEVAGTQALRRHLAVPWAAHRSARPRQAERPAAEGNPPPLPGLRAPPGGTGWLLQLTEPPHPRRVAPRGGTQRRIRDNRAVRSPDSSRQILRAIGVDQHPRTSAPGRTVRLPRHVLLHLLLMASGQRSSVTGMILPAPLGECISERQQHPARSDPGRVLLPAPLCGAQLAAGALTVPAQAGPSRPGQES